METLYGGIKSVLDNVRQHARQHVVRAVNATMIEAYWHISRIIVEDEQLGNSRAEYGIGLIQDLSKRLTAEHGTGFGPSDLNDFKRFYLVLQTHNLHTARDEFITESFHLSPKLTWSHYRRSVRVENEKARTRYITESIAQNWSSRALDRQINSFYYERILATREANRPDIRQETDETTKPLALHSEDILKDPYILEFPDLKPNWKVYEKDLEQGLIDNLQKFLLELGKGFAFVARQQRISTKSGHFFIDLVFYNYLLKCFVLIDLKTTKLTHQDIGQVDMYIRIYKDLHKLPGDNLAISLILCIKKEATVLKYSVLNGSENLFASRYKSVLPTEDELKAEIERERFLLEQTR